MSQLLTTTVIHDGLHKVSRDSIEHASARSIACERHGTAFECIHVCLCRGRHSAAVIDSHLSDVVPLQPRHVARRSAVVKYPSNLA